MTKLTTYILMALVTTWMVVAGFICIKYGNADVVNTVFWVSVFTLAINYALILARYCTAENNEVI